MKKQCRNCQFFKISWDYAKPYSCDFFNFKSKQIPSMVVKQNSGKDCEGFKQKKKANKRQES